MQELSKVPLTMFSEGQTDILPRQKFYGQLNGSTSQCFSADEMDAGLQKLMDENKIILAGDQVMLV